MQKKITHSLFFLTILVFLYNCKVETTQGKWMNQSNNIERLDDSIFKNPLQFYSSELKLQYSIKNDDKNLYVYIKSTERLPQIKIIRTGITLKFKASPKDKNQSSIVYPITTSKTQLPSKDWETFVSRFSYDHPIMKIQGFKNIQEDELFLKNHYGISVSIVWDSTDVLRYKAIVPFSRFLKDSLCLNDSNLVLGFSIVLNALKDQKNDQQQSPNSTGTARYQQSMMNKSNPRFAYNQNAPQSDEQAYLFNIRSVKINYRVAVKKK